MIANHLHSFWLKSVRPHVIEDKDMKDLRLYKSRNERIHK